MKDTTSLQTIIDYFDTTELGIIFDRDVPRHCRIFDYERGELICENGEDFDYLLFLMAGETKVFTMLDNGKVYLLRIEVPFTVYGDIEVLFDQVYSANVEALGNCRCLAVPIGYIRGHCLDSPAFLKYVIRSLSSRLDTISHMSTSNLLLPLKNKFAGYLLAHKEAHRDVVVMRTSYLNVAEQLGTTYRHLSRTIKEMIEEGLISKEGKKLTIVAMGKVSDLAGNTYRY